MTLAERIPTLDDDALKTLGANARRLEAEGGRRQEEAAMLVPLIEAELADRQARKPAKPAKPASAPRRKRAKA